MPNDIQPGGTPLSLADLRRAVRRNRALLLGVTAAVVALTALATVLLPPVYESAASVRIESQDAKGGLLAQMSGLGDMGLPGLGSEEVSTEMGVIRSRRITEPVVRSLALHVQLREPEALRSEVLVVHDAPEDALPGDYSLRLQPDGAYRLEARKVRTASGEYTRSAPAVRAAAGPPQRVEIGTPFRIGGATLALAPQLRADPEEEIRFRILPFFEAVEALREEDLRVGRVDGSNLVSLEYRHRDPELAAATVNGITDTFVAHKLRTDSTDSRSREQVLREEVRAHEARLADLEDRMRRFQEQELMIAPEEQAAEQVKRVAAIQAEKDAMVVERNSLARLLTEIAREEGNSAAYRKLATFPSLISNGAIQDLLQSLVELENERAELLVRRTPENSDVRGYTERIEELEAQLYRLGQDYLRNLDGTIAAADVTLAGFREEIAAMPAPVIQFARLALEQETLGEVYVILQTQLKQEQIQGAIERGTGEVRVIDRGIVPLEPVFPKPVVNLLLGTVLGLMLGTIAVIGRESLDSTVRSPAEARSASAGLPVLGSIPRIRSTAGSGPATNGKRRTPWERIATFPYRVVSPGSAGRGEGRLVTRWAPFHPASEAFRSLRTNLAFAGGERDPQVILVTSARPGEGKSTVAANLAVAFAQGGSRTLLIDADLRRGSLGGVFGLPREPGLSDALAGALTAPEAVQEVPLGERSAALHLIASGRVTADSTELLASDGFERLLRELRGRYDRIVLDSPALQPVADASVLGRSADASLVVVRAGATPHDVLAEAVDLLLRVQARVGGIVLNEAYEISDAGYGYAPRAAQPPSPSRLAETRRG